MSLDWYIHNWQGEEVEPYSNYGTIHKRYRLKKFPNIIVCDMFNAEYCNSVHWCKGIGGIGCKSIPPTFYFYASGYSAHKE